MSWKCNSCDSLFGDYTMRTRREFTNACLHCGSENCIVFVDSVKNNIKFRGMLEDGSSTVTGGGVYVSGCNAYAFIILDGGFDKGHRSYVDPFSIECSKDGKTWSKYNEKE